MKKIIIVAALAAASCSAADNERVSAYDECIQHKAGTPDQCVDAAFRLHPDEKKK